MIKRLWLHLSKLRQKQFFLVFTLMIFASLTEIVSIGSVLPFLGALTSPEQVFFHPLTQKTLETVKFLSVSEPKDLIFPLTIIFISVTIFAGLIRLALLYFMTRISYSTGADLSIDIYHRTLYQEYSVHVTRNSSEVINGIITKTGVAIGVIRSFLTLLSSFVLLVGVIVVLFSIDTSVALISFLSFGLIYALVIKITRIQLKENSEIIAKKSNLMVKALQEGLGGIRDVLINGSQDYFTNIYKNSDLPLRHAQGNNVFIAQSPRFAMEALGISLIAILAYIVIQFQDGTSSAIPVLGAMALGAQKLLPILQQAYGSFSNIKGAKKSFQDVLELLDQKIPIYANQHNPKPIKFESEICMKNLEFCYSDNSPIVLKALDLRFKKGARIGIVGNTGSGKSTLIDILMGLLYPSNGSLIIDNQEISSENVRAWQAHIAHVPQNIYLADASIEENIAFGILKNDIDRDKVKVAAEKAQILDVVESWKDGLDTNIGEHGAKISGGQRQRIGIARALYKDADVLIFDEATSSLDMETEKSVMTAIDKLDKNLTIIIVAHRLSTLKNCNEIIKISDDKSISHVNYEDLVNNS